MRARARVPLLPLHTSKVGYRARTGRGIIVSIFPMMRVGRWLWYTPLAKAHQKQAQCTAHCTSGVELYHADPGWQWRLWMLLGRVSEWGRSATRCRGWRRGVCGGPWGSGTKLPLGYSKPGIQGGRRSCWEYKKRGKMRLALWNARTTAGFVSPQHTHGYHLPACERIFQTRFSP